jgi:ankyrin repeat protein
MNIQRNDGMTALQVAAYYGHYEILNIMIMYAEKRGEKEKKRLMNKLNEKSEMSALSYAILNNRSECASLLVV